MHTTTLRKVGGSIMLAVPAGFLERLHLQAGATVSLVVEQGSLVVNPGMRPRYTLAELLAACDVAKPVSTEEREWLDAPLVGDELM
ncbi:AbrB/MazE/SpoVT family DNA-binding domain-containing protein [Sulfuriferula nivalis]|uniref:MazE family transcriptional regulator n=1 Tax=Sulfuriferula nivalis TaxID=2675298 RepID=A0A809S5J8_9PROT|nr:antitoxin [Sulfuriferula nivalis]BBP02558.1 MazE family transcriptional regulator [Sulfuriferula nivalis]